MLAPARDCLTWRKGAVVRGTVLFALLKDNCRCFLYDVIQIMINQHLVTVYEKCILK